MRKESKRLGRNLVRIRKGKGISQERLSKMLRTDRSFVSTIENGKTNPTLATIARLAKAIGVSVSELSK
ncbi:MAG: helix-turn-helix transcriptional regulator [bacterium]|nr:helix-turn-helix transcriptional regulator [bacterium]